MPDKCGPSWVRHQDYELSDYDLKTSDRERYKLHLTQISDQTVYDDVGLSHIQSDLAIHLQLYNEDESNLFITLNPDKLEGDSNYKKTETIHNCEGCSIIRKRDYDESICEVCQKNIPRKSQLIAFTGGTVSAELHCSCWASVITDIRRFVKQNSEKTLSRIL